VLVYFDGACPGSSTGLISAAELISGSCRCELYAVCVNCRPEGIATEFDYLIEINDKRIGHFDAPNIAAAIDALNALYGFDCILFPATFFGRIIAPRVAMRLKVGLTADVTMIRNDGGCVELIRPAFCGKSLARVVNRGGRPLMATVRPGVFGYERKGLKMAKTVHYEFSGFESPRIELVEQRETTTSRDIRDSSVLVSGGGGVAGSFGKLDELARCLGGMVSASRQLVDGGIARRAIQVGQSGKTVSPELYIALGIHGASQHMAGLKNVKSIIAVNTNRYAPICSQADIVVEGDAVEFIEKLCARISAGQAEQAVAK